MPPATSPTIHHSELTRKTGKSVQIAQGNYIRKEVIYIIPLVNRVLKQCRQSVQINNAILIEFPSIELQEGKNTKDATLVHLCEITASVIKADNFV